LSRGRTARQQHHQRDSAEDDPPFAIFATNQKLPSLTPGMP